jgi:outer membrane protein assembly factor BamA
MVVLDSRDNTLATRRGVYILGSLVSFHPWLGSDYRYTAFTVDARHYHTAGRHTLALQYYLALCDGDVPLTGMPMMGGKTLMRGHYEGRFRDRNFFTVQAEYRLMPLWWRFGVNVFAGLGEVAPRLRDFTFEGLKWSLGAGLRFALNPAERIHLRLDVGVGYDTWGLYVNVLEVF